MVVDNPMSINDVDGVVATIGAFVIVSGHFCCSQVST
jgi:hypothetical protein